LEAWGPLGPRSLACELGPARRWFVAVGGCVCLKLLLKHHTLATTLIITVKVRGKKVTTRNPLTIVYRKPKTRKH
jgi:hypothetical protein